MSPTLSGGVCNRSTRARLLTDCKRRRSRSAARGPNVPACRKVVTMRYKLLGPLEVERDGMPVAIGGPQQRRLLGLLLAGRDQVVSVDRMVDALWADRAPDGAARSVMTYVSRLRAALGDGTVV